MAEPYLGEISMVGFNFAPRGWADCAGQILPINQNQALFSLLGTMYGGDGRTTFVLPDLRGRVPLHQGSVSGTDRLGQKGGAEQGQLTTAQMPAHTHGGPASIAVGDSNDPAIRVPAVAPGGPAQARLYGDSADVPMHPDVVGSAGDGIAHNNLQPYLAVRFIIALQGVFPSRN